MHALREGFNDSCKTRVQFSVLAKKTMKIHCKSHNIFCINRAVKFKILHVLCAFSVILRRYKNYDQRKHDNEYIDLVRTNVTC